MDRKWWQVMQPQFDGECVTVAGNVLRATRTNAPKGGNSGAGAMLLARHRGATRIVLLGYDCQYAPDGKRHWHGNHRNGLGNAVSLPKFYGQFEEARDRLYDVEVINCSRATALDMWPRGRLEDELAEDRQRSLRRAG
ncbi:hypothetical protein [Aidingimonas halophila]|uniref:Uncharacterized protein n=1 Tax=Aidingimonas halophila TaxID=574349 RepID=A0A1H2RD52_9GAMM|nr:hypothetical protein [Aidingimonas halophila]GHC19430.1 hypothetical protein GCM10008094_06820 [Aidingimonas halophila]SDW17362.1 hypothetical protein SAMN05443545_101290 [Aidingimonas halophila]